MSVASLVKNKLSNLFRRKSNMCCSVKFEEERKDLNSAKNKAEILLPLRILKDNTQPEIRNIRDDFPALSQRINGKQIVYLDNACMSLRPKPVIDAITSYYYEYSGCHGRVDHYFGTATTRAYESARETVRKHIGAGSSSEVIFIRNTTEGVNFIANTLYLKQGDAVLCSDLEHNSNLLPWLALRDRANIEHRIFDTADDTSFDMDSFLKKLDSRVKLVSVLLTSNLTGVTFPIREIIRESHRAGALVLIDAAQGALYHDIDVKDLDVDFMVFSGHKIVGPTGTGVLYVKERLLSELPCFLFGGETVVDTTYTGFTLGNIPNRHEAGLQDYAGVIGLGAAIQFLHGIGTGFIRKQINKLNAMATEELAKTKGVKVIGPADPGKRAGILNFYVEGMASSDISYLLNKSANIMTRSGRHCVHSWYNARKIPDSVRASFSFYNTPEEVEFFVWTLRDIIRFYT